MQENKKKFFWLNGYQNANASSLDESDTDDDSLPDNSPIVSTVSSATNGSGYEKKKWAWISNPMMH